eukprot:CAMPEP_0116833470 /NCGR_PEP_ID=MMETSP0418-20121206/6455_1 /TAXON_ID=1158023 /ORGANISM="Astrosyne radiata, Strain 13vi08-1A" /LENGTH=83 /DNA_ID=CAMNT_0004462925 /DNA_START=176 /DNA_END=427 /DNA_ORIENTATION=-
MENLNSPEYMERTKIQLFDILKEVEPVPSTQIQTGQVDSQLNPRSAMMEVDDPAADDDDNRDPDRRVTRDDTGRKEHPSELAS